MDYTSSQEQHSGRRNSDVNGQQFASGEKAGATHYAMKRKGAKEKSAHHAGEKRIKMR